MAVVTSNHLVSKCNYVMNRIEHDLNRVIVMCGRRHFALVSRWSNVLANKIDARDTGFQSIQNMNNSNRNKNTIC